MATPVVFNGVNYSVPGFGDVGYAQGPGNLSSYLVAIASGTFQTTGGLFSLTADANFGPNFGLVSIYYKSASANIATAGILRLANTDTIDWRNFANTANLALGVNASDVLTFNGTPIGSVASGLQFQIPYFATTGTVLTGAANIHYNAAGDFEVLAGHNVVLDGATSGAVSLKAPAVTTPYTFTYPPNSGTLNYFLQTDGTGVTNWAPAGGVGQFEYVVFIVGTPSGTYTGSTTIFDLPFTYVTDGKHIEFFYNGQQLRFNNDYTETTNTRVTTTSPLVAGSAVWFRTVTGGIVAPATVTLLREDYIVGTPQGSYTGSLTVFNLTNTYTVGGNAIMVTLDGDVQTKGATADYLETNSSTITFNNALVVGERVSFLWSQTAGISGGTVNPGTINQLAVYASSGSTVNGTPAITTDGTVVTTTVPTKIKGTTTNDNAAVGYVGEYLRAFGQVPSGSIPTTGTWFNIASISLTAGDWDVSGCAEFEPGPSSTSQSVGLALSLFSAPAITDHIAGDNDLEGLPPITAQANCSISIPAWRVSLAAPQTVYLKANWNYTSIVSARADGRISARRVR